MSTASVMFSAQVTASKTSQSKGVIHYNACIITVACCVARHHGCITHSEVTSKTKPIPTDATKASLEEHLIKFT